MSVQIVAMRNKRKVADSTTPVKAEKLVDCLLAVIHEIESGTPRLISGLASLLTDVAAIVTFHEPLPGGQAAEQWRRAIGLLSEVVSIRPEERTNGDAPVEVISPALDDFQSAIFPPDDAQGERHVYEEGGNTNG